MTNQEKVTEAAQALVDFVNRLGGDASVTIADHGEWQEFQIVGEIGKIKQEGFWKTIMRNLE